MKNILNFLKDKRNVIPIFVISVALLLTAILLGYCIAAFVFPVIGEHTEPVMGIQDGVTENGYYSGYTYTSGKPSVFNESLEMRGVWIASVLNINYPSKKGLPVEELALEVDKILDTAKAAGLNAVFFQVRPSSDALYKSEIFPWSEYLTGTQGQAPENNFDPLRYFIDRAHEKGLSLHAWVNPYRITSGSKENPKHDTSLLAENNPARLHPEYTVPYADGKLYYDPGIPEVRKICVDGVKELLQNYPDLDGIHFDDYFYPYPFEGEPFNDTDTYAKYGGTLTLDDWRRENVNTLIREVYTAVKEANPECRFGVSPFGIRSNSTSDTKIAGSETEGLESYFSLYCDPLAWAEEGTVDYLAPQIYWSFSTGGAPFDTLARWWNAVLDGTGVDLYIGHAAYKAEDYAENELPIQVEFGRNLMCYRGSIFYGYADIAENKAGLLDGLSKTYAHEINFKAVTPTNKPLKINQPEDGSSFSFPSVCMTGSSDPAFPVIYGGQKLSRTKSGFFCIYSTLSEGVNRFKITQNNNEYVHTLNKKTTDDATAVKMDKYEIGITSPGNEAWVMSGEKLNLMVQAPAGSTVTAYVGNDISVELLPTIKSDDADALTVEVYKGSIQIPVSADENGAASLGELRFVASNGIETATKTVGEIKELAEEAYIYAEVINDYSYLKLSPKSSFYDDFTPVNAGMRDYVTGLEDGYYRLKFGGYISKEDVKITEGETLLYNIVSEITVKPVISDTSNNLENYTEVRFKISENSPSNITVSGNKITVTLYDTYNRSIPEAVIENNPMVASIVGNISEDESEFIIELKDEMNYYGCNGVYEDGCFVLKLNNPQSLAAGNTPLAGKTVIIDAGHGGSDSGALGPVSAGIDSINESELNLAIALSLEEKLTALGAKVVMTRSDDSTLELTDRIKFLASANPDFEVSIHHNSIESSVNAAKVRGTLALYSHEGGKLLAESFSNSMASSLGKLKRKTSYQKLAVARNHRFPSALCEVCFLSNIEEYEWAVTEGNSDRCATALADGVLNFYKAQERFLLKK